MNLHEIYLASLLAKNGTGGSDADLSDCYTKLQTDSLISEVKAQTALNRSTLGYQRKNLFDFSAWSSALVKNANRGTYSVSDNSIAMTSVEADYYTQPDYIGNGGNPCRIPVLPSTKYVLSWEIEGENDARIVVFKNGKSANNILADRPKDNKLEFTTDSDTVFITLRFGIISKNKTMAFKNIMIRNAEIEDYAYESYQPSLLEKITALEARITALEENIT